jgi:hypothetical protein
MEVKAELDCTEGDLHSVRKMGEAALPVTYCISIHQPVMKDCNSSIKVGDYERSKSQTLKFTNVKTHQVLCALRMGVDCWLLVRAVVTSVFVSDGAAGS